MLISLDYLIKKYDLKIKCVSHFGAHLGQEIDSYLQNNISNIHLFEPQTKIFNQLVSNHKKKGLHFYNFGLGSQNKKLKIYLDSGESQSSSILKPKSHLNLHPNIKFQGTEDIEVKIYDNLKIQNINFLNIDVQGYELEALIGCKDSLHQLISYTLK
ncbi:FkbM family methyltransferase [Acidimicrobiia bacterium]|nr:FkbM family methyltransferase [Acidimicrobiia bacterium]